MKKEIVIKLLETHANANIILKDGRKINYGANTNIITHGVYSLSFNNKFAGANTGIIIDYSDVESIEVYGC